MILEPNTRGTDLPIPLQREALQAYVHRFTGDHRPRWAMHNMDNGQAYAVQFRDDQDWLANTLFRVSKTAPARLIGHCYSRPTWPFNPELHPHSGQRVITAMNEPA